MYRKNTALNVNSFLTLVFFQFVLLLILFFITHLKFGFDVALSGSYGGIVSIFSTFLFFVIFFFKSGNTSPKFIIKKFYLAGFLKIAVLILIFSFLFNLGLYSPICFFIFLFFIQLSFWFGYFYFFMGI